MTGAPGFALPQAERIAALVAAVGGPVKAAAIIGKTRTHIDNMRKPDAPLRLDDVLALATAAGVSLDWVATGHHVRPDLAARVAETGELQDAGAAGFGGLPGFARLQPVRPEVVRAGGRSVGRWMPSDIAVSAQWLDGMFGLTSDSARYAKAGDAGMAPAIGKDALVIVDMRPATLRTGIYLVGVGDELLARRLSRLPGGAAGTHCRWRCTLALCATVRTGGSGAVPDRLGGAGSLGGRVPLR